MAAIIAALVIALFGAGGFWLIFGNRFELDADPRQNDILNLGVYLGTIFLVSLIAVLVVTRI